jgi:hypothetical protein
MIVVMVFSIFSFLSIFSNGGVSRDRLGQAFRLGLRPKALLISGLALLAGIVFMMIMTLIGAALSVLLATSVPGVVFTVIGAAGLIYVMFASAYILNYMAIQSLRDKKRIGFREASQAFFAKQGQVILLPLIVGGIILTEMAIFLILDLGRGEDFFFFLSCLFTVPFLPINLILVVLVVLGGGIFLPLMIDQDKGALGTFKGIAAAVKQRFMRLLNVQAVVIIFLAVIALVMYLILALASRFGAVDNGQTPVMAVMRGLLSDPAALFDFRGAPVLYLLGYLLITVTVLAVMLLAASIIWNMNMCLYSVFYLDHIKGSVDFNEPLIKKKQ